MDDGTKPYNPLDEQELGKAIARKFEGRPELEFPPPRFKGTGLYALYYRGSHPAYIGLSGTGFPIYVGKAEAGSGRHGRLEDPTVSTRLYQRIRKHSRSVALADNLSLDDFTCRYLVMSDAWIVLGEQGLLREYQPLWNLVITGFGNNPPGGGRINQEASRWDTLHPGRDKHRDVRPPNGLSAKELESVAREAVAEAVRSHPIRENLLGEDPGSYDPGSES